MMKNGIEVGCYYWSGWHPTPGNDKERGHGWTEWEYLKRAVPRFPGHQQPKYPIWGYLDDSKAETVQRQIDTAADYGIDAFIFDWSYKSFDPPFDRFSEAPNRNRLKFAFMMCGHPKTADECLEMFDFIIENYFKQPNYWRMSDGSCYFSVYEIGKWANQLGGIAPLKELIGQFRQKCAAQGLTLHFVAVEWGLQKLCCQDLDPLELVKEVGVDALASYVWAHNTVPAWPCGDYSAWAEDAYEAMRGIEQKYPVPYHTNVTMGWDPSPRCPEDRYYDDGGPLMYHTLWGEFQILHQPYFSAIVKNNTPAEFRRALLAAKRHLIDTDPKDKIVTLYAWNEWTEGGYLEPEKKYGYGYLEAIQSVFGV